MIRITTVLGTRPEAVKLAPVLAALGQRRDDFDVTTVATGQQGPVFTEAIQALDLRIDRWLDVLTTGQPLWQLNARLMEALGQAFDAIKPDLVIVQGDTQTTLAGAMTACLRQTPVAHVEAGLRSGNPDAPFPEEVNRRAIAQVARLHFAATGTAAENLLREGIARKNIAITGNTVVDTLLAFRRRSGADKRARKDNRLRVLVTSHRRESWDTRIDQICTAVRDIADLLPEAEIQFIRPLSPQLRSRIDAAFKAQPRVRLINPLAYPAFLEILARADLVLTDSGGIQEEASTLGIPTVVMRNETDRPESLNMAHIKLAGTARESIVGAARSLFHSFNDAPRAAASPFGDGHAANRIVRAIDNWRSGLVPLLSPAEEFGG